jgi:hypothetical protein
VNLDSSDEWFDGPTSGASAGINSLSFYTCRACGACVAEIDAYRSHRRRQLHSAWHEAMVGALGRSIAPPEVARRIRAGIADAELLQTPGREPWDVKNVES